MEMKISGFTFGYNLISGGYPIVEAVEAVRPYVDEIVAVDAGSTDETGYVLKHICHKCVTGPAWEGRDIQHRIFELHQEYCQGDIIVLFEADEVYDDNLLAEALWAMERGHFDIGVHRIQVTQNFQRIKEYPVPVHRIFPKGGGTYRNHPTACPEWVTVLPASSGLLWDCSNCFRDNWADRKRGQAQVWGESRSLIVNQHFTMPNEVEYGRELQELEAAYWTWPTTPLNIPDVLKPLVGQTRYRVNL